MLSHVVHELPAIHVACWYLYLHSGVVEVELRIFAVQHAPMLLALIKVAVSVLCAVFTCLVDLLEASACVVKSPHAVLLL